MKPKRSSITLTGKDYKALQDAKQLWRVDDKGHELSAARVIGDSLRFRMDNQFHGHDILRHLMISFKEVARIEGCNTDTMRFIDWWLVRMQDLMSGRVSAARLFDTIRRVERLMKQEDKDQEELDLEQLLSGV